MKIVVAEKIAPAALALLEEESKWQVVGPDAINGSLAAHLESADALIVRSAVFVDGKTLDAAKKLRVIGRAGVGVDNIDVEAATKRGIAVMNTPGANAVAVAEHAFAMMLALARHLTRADATTRSGKWEKKSLQGTELRGKTLGIVGLGRIGVEVARRAKAFGMKVVAHDPFVSTVLVRELGVTLATLDEIYKDADYLTLHVGLTPQTQGMINPQTLARMKRGARIVNCARGELIDEQALAAALKSGHIAGAALDVFTVEPPKDSPLLALANVLLTPHIAGSTFEAQEAVGVQIAMQVREYLKRGVIQNAVNVPSLTHEEYVEMQPYIALAERLGAFLANVTAGNVEAVSVRYSGRIAEWKTELLRNAAVKGILNQMLAEKANLVNAAAIAAERGVEVSEIKKPKASSGGAGNVMTVLLKTNSEERLAKGAVLHGKSPRLLAVDDIDVEAPLERDLIYMRNNDVPGVIGKVGTILGKHAINIANFSLGRREKNGKPAEAIAVVHVDSKPTEAVLDELRKIEAVKLVKAMRL
ncbi:MAG: phosphoglycerate dehydrogenase [Candidatus Koribacter versatilis]|uniref:D-3-phosphoglycerate dehydrogenase n=1 Tax=Candidatus Korobacter versatilis TaxID=658062 RepID=A0A932A8Y0_9BACT|nr:phosphoglycerate dehydrogenase [Candidatus Koribacter versatilis]